jgi:HD-like signal output (HDOD) protein
MEVTTSQQSLLNLKAISARAGDLPPIPAIAFQALQLTKDPNSSARQLQSVIARDQALAARILRIVNSAMYCLCREVSTISHAVAILGMETLRSVLMAAAVQQLFQGGMGRRDLTSKLLADHSWGAAIAAGIIAKRTGYESCEEAFLCGLMHDIGKLVLKKNFAGQYLNIISDTYRGETTFCDAEMAVFGFTHAHVGALVSEKWNFPPQLSFAIGFHHKPVSAPMHTKLACIVSLSNAAMIRLEVGIQKNRGLELEKEVAAEFLKLEIGRAS